MKVNQCKGVEGMSPQVIISALALVCTILTVTVVILTFTRNRDKDTRTDATENAVVRTKLDSIQSGVSNIQVEIRANEKRINEVSEVTVTLRESHRALEQRVQRLEDKQ
jgi:uncharacterized protein YlxW (UPF0749 family)